MEWITKDRGGKNKNFRRGAKRVFNDWENGKPRAEAIHGKHASP